MWLAWGRWEGEDVSLPSVLLGAHVWSVSHKVGFCIFRGTTWGRDIMHQDLCGGMCGDSWERAVERCCVLSLPSLTRWRWRGGEKWGVGGGIVWWLAKRDERTHLHTNGEHHFLIHFRFEAQVATPGVWTFPRLGDCIFLCNHRTIGNRVGAGALVTWSILFSQWGLNYAKTILHWCLSDLSLKTSANTFLGLRSPILTSLFPVFSLVSNSFCSSCILSSFIYFSFVWRTDYFLFATTSSYLDCHDLQFFASNFNNSILWFLP